MLVPWNSTVKSGRLTLVHTQRPDDPLIRAVKYPVIHRLNSKGVRKRVEKIVTEIGLRPPLAAWKK